MKRGENDRKRKLDRGQPQLCLGDMEREAGGDLDIGIYYPGEFQRRHRLDGDPKHQRSAPGHRLRPAGAVLRDGCGQDLWQLYGSESQLKILL